MVGSMNANTRAKPPSSAPTGRGYATSAASAPLSELSTPEGYEQLACDAIGSFIEFWGFKRNQGRLWALLYLRGVPISSGELQKSLSLTKGAVSMITRDLEYWGVVRRTRLPGDRSSRYTAETDLVKLISRVLREREANVLAQVRTDLVAAEQLARREGTRAAEALGRLRKLRLLTEAAEKTLDVFLRSTRFSLTSLLALMRRSL